MNIQNENVQHQTMNKNINDFTANIISVILTQMKSVDRREQKISTKFTAQSTRLWSHNPTDT